MEVDPDPRESTGDVAQAPRMRTLEGKETTPRQLLMLSENALRSFERSGMAYDLEYIGACILQVLCGLYGGTAVGARRTGGLDCGVFANVRFCRFRCFWVCMDVCVLDWQDCQYREGDGSCH